MLGLFLSCTDCKSFSAGKANAITAITTLLNISLTLQFPTLFKQKNPRKLPRAHATGFLPGEYAKCYILQGIGQINTEWAITYSEVAILLVVHSPKFCYVY